METNTETPGQNGAANTPSAPARKPDNRKRNAAIAAALVAAVVIALGLGGYFYFQFQEKAQDEQLAYEVLENNDNPQDYRDFLTKYPESSRAGEVRERLAKLEEMLRAWQGVALSDNTRDFIDFKSRYGGDAQYARLCDIKIDSLDWVAAQQAGTQEAFQRYLDMHPDGRYASEASVSQGNLRSQEVTDDETAEVSRLCSDFFTAFEKRDEAGICSNITATMTQFLNKRKATKADVVAIVKGMFNEHIQGCQFVVNRDITVTRKADGQGGFCYSAEFTVDQHIQRDNEGKTFGSYKAAATVTPQFLISSLTLTEISKQ